MKTNIIQPLSSLQIVILGIPEFRLIFQNLDRLNVFGSNY